MFLLIAILKIEVFVESAILIMNLQIFDKEPTIMERIFCTEANLSLICCNLFTSAGK
jgi:hypothetical protein